MNDLAIMIANSASRYAAEETATFDGVSEEVRAKLRAQIIAAYLSGCMQLATYQCKMDGDASATPSRCVEAAELAGKKLLGHGSEPPS